LDWEEENAEEDINEGAEEEEESGDDEDDNSLLGDWLVGDDEIEFVDDGSGSPVKTTGDDVHASMLDKQARAKEAYEQAVAKRKVEKVVPFTKGPIWETQYGKVEWVGFEAYRICFLNGGFSAVMDLEVCRN
jgi:chromatin assembly factor 1 subunit A